MVTEPHAPLLQPPSVPGSLPPSPFRPMVFSSAERLLLCCSRSPQAPAEDLPSMLPVSSAKPYEPHAPAVGLGDEAGWQQVGSGRRYGRSIPPPSSRVEALERSLSFKLWARGRCFHCLECGHQVGTCREPFYCILCHCSGHREHNCHRRSPVGRSPTPRSRSPSASSPCPAQSRT
jgi:hypothetical protein